MTEKPFSPAMRSALKAVARMKGDSTLAWPDLLAEREHDDRYSTQEKTDTICSMQDFDSKCSLSWLSRASGTGDARCNEKMPEVTFPLKPEEQDLLCRIRFDVLAIGDPEAFRRNGEAICTLTKMLLARSAIPKVRIKYFNDPEYFVGGRGKSHRQIFEQNGTKGDNILRHGNFVKYFYYFLFGPNLPETIIEAFQKKVDDCGGVTSDDIVPLGEFARSLARSFSSTPSNTAEEFYKLALEFEIWPSYAEIIMKSVKQAKSRANR